MTINFLKYIKIIGFSTFSISYVSKFNSLFIPIVNKKIIALLNTGSFDVIGESKYESIEDTKLVNDIFMYNNTIEKPIIKNLNRKNNSNELICLSSNSNNLYKISLSIDNSKKIILNKIGYSNLKYTQYGNNAQTIALKLEISDDDKYILVVTGRIESKKYDRYTCNNINLSIYNTNTLTKISSANINHKVVVYEYGVGLLSKIDAINNKLYVAFPPNNIYAYDIGRVSMSVSARYSESTGGVKGIISFLSKNGYATGKLFIDNKINKFNFGFINESSDDNTKFTMCKLIGNSIVPYKYSQIPFIKIARNAYISINKINNSNSSLSEVGISLFKYDNINNCMYFEKIDEYLSNMRTDNEFENTCTGGTRIITRSSGTGMIYSILYYINSRLYKYDIIESDMVPGDNNDFTIKPKSFIINTIKTNYNINLSKDNYNIFDISNNENITEIVPGKNYMIKLLNISYKPSKSKYTSDEFLRLYNESDKSITIDIIPIKPSVDINKSIVSISCEIPFKYRIKLDNGEYSMYSNSFESSTQLDLSKILIGNIESITIEATPIYSLQSSEHSTVKTYNKSDIINYIPSLNIINNDDIKISDNNKIYKNIIPIEFKNNTSKISINHNDMNFNRLAISIDSTVSKFYNVEINYKNDKYIDSCIISDDNFATPIDIDIKLIKKENIEDQVIVGTVDVTMKLYKEGD